VPKLFDGVCTLPKSFMTIMTLSLSKNLHSNFIPLPLLILRILYVCIYTLRSSYFIINEWRKSLFPDPSLLLKKSFLSILLLFVENSGVYLEK